jgi:hypothetical protein
MNFCWVLHAHSTIRFSQDKLFMELRLVMSWVELSDQADSPPLPATVPADVASPAAAASASETKVCDACFA